MRREEIVPLNSTQEIDQLTPAPPLYTLLLMLLAIAAGVLVATTVLPTWLPGLSASLLGPEPKVYWYLSRSSAIVAYLLLWVSMATSLAISNRLARLWPGGPIAFDLHQYTSLLGLGFALFHALILLGDQYMNYSLGQVLTPFASVGYRPLWVGHGQISWYVLVVVSLSFYVRRKIGHRLWRLVHFLSYVMFALALIHGLMSGTDSGATWARAMYWVSAASVLFLTIYRMLSVYVDHQSTPKKRVQQVRR
jgi:predicted ferric reductase